MNVYHRYTFYVEIYSTVHAVLVQQYCTVLYIYIYLYIYISMGPYGVPGSLSMGPCGVPGSRDSRTQGLGSWDSGTRDLGSRDSGTRDLGSRDLGTRAQGVSVQNQRKYRE